MQPRVCTEASTPPPVSPYSLSEEKVFRSSITDIVTEKNQKNEKLLPEKKGRLMWIENDLPLESMCSPVAPA
jgi:hypothetical protein